MSPLRVDVVDAQLALAADRGAHPSRSTASASAATVDHLHARWSAAGITIEQAPFTAVFGRTFVALDPDGHRLRVCTPDP